MTTLSDTYKLAMSKKAVIGLGLLGAGIPLTVAETARRTKKDLGDDISAMGKIGPAALGIGAATTARPALTGALGLAIEQMEHGQRELQQSPREMRVFDTFRKMRGAKTVPGRAGQTAGAMPKARATKVIAMLEELAKVDPKGVDAEVMKGFGVPLKKLPKGADLLRGDFAKLNPATAFHEMGHLQAEFGGKTMAGRVYRAVEKPVTSAARVLRPLTLGASLYAAVDDPESTAAKFAPLFAGATARSSLRVPGEVVASAWAIRLLRRLRGKGADLSGPKRRLLVALGTYALPGLLAAGGVEAARQVALGVKETKPEKEPAEVKVGAKVADAGWGVIGMRKAMAPESASESVYGGLMVRKGRLARKMEIRLPGNLQDQVSTSEVVSGAY